jgi:ribose 5-phosphate isomerase A
MTGETLNRNEQKKAAADHAAAYVESGMRLGLGTGSTAAFFLESLAERLRDDRLRDIVGVATSSATIQHARRLGVPLVSLDEALRLDLTVDGADEIDPQLDLIKGHGGALLWEKMVAVASDRLIIVADESKLVDRLGVRMSLPVEVIPFGWSTHLPFLEELGANPALRRSSAAPIVTDGGHYLIDCVFPGGVTDPERVAALLKARTGIVESGLFVGMTSVAIVATAAGLRTFERGVVV